jgi:PIN domain nuclease of toxin-antitoxin system
MADPANILFLSVASAWEIRSRYSLANSVSLGDAASYVQNRAAHNQMEILPISLEHAAALQSLPLLHRDPFDRMLVVQSQIERLSLLTADPDIRNYEVDAVW